MGALWELPNQKGDKEAMSGFANLLNKFSGASEDPAELPPEPTRGGLESFIQKFAGVTEEYKFYGDTVTLRFDKNHGRTS